MTNDCSTSDFPANRLGRRKFLKQAAFAIAGTTTLAAFLAACGDNPADSVPTTAVTDPPITLTYQIDSTQTTKDIANAYITAYQVLHPNVTINLEIRPGGSDGDNLVKTRLATGDMADIFEFLPGSQLQGTNPAQNLVDLSKEPFIANLSDVFIATVSHNDQIFGVPFGAGSAGGILYNKKVYAQLGLSVPKNWAEFEANNDKIKAAGIAPVLQAYGGSDSWTSQLFVLGDYYNVTQANPNFATDYTYNKVKFATNPEAMVGFTYLQEGFKKGWYQKDFATTSHAQALKMLAEGTGAHYPMLSSAVSAIQTSYPDKASDIGFFGQPGKDASKNGATVWMPSGTYIPKTTKNLTAAKDFLAFMASPAAIDALNAKIPPTGPYYIKGAKLPENTLPAFKDISAYINAGKVMAALEFFSPVKGPVLEQICVAVGSGQMSPQQAASNYDYDVAKQARQLGLPGW